MNPLAVPFTADPRNQGGRSQIQQLMNIHRSKLRNMKPAIKIQTPHPHIKQICMSRRSCDDMSPFYSNLARKNIEIMHSPDFAQVRATYRTIATLRKGQIDSAAPKSFHFIWTLSKNKKVNSYKRVEHLRNMNSLQRRMDRIERGNV